MFKVIITTVGNPDYNQDPDRPLWGVPEGEALDAPTLEALVEKVREFQDDYDIGGGNWSLCRVFKAEKLIGFMSYNGRVWDRERWGKDAVEYKESV